MSDVLSSLGGSRVPELSSSLAINTSFTLPNPPCSFMYELGVLIKEVEQFRYSIHYRELLVHLKGFTYVGSNIMDQKNVMRLSFTNILCSNLHPKTYDIMVITQ